ncbi:MAG: bifunctional UDP-N-acetylglucosamine diphosphorylase/glucosamine-1-phosphate N-acetyltransferase GlmU [Desulfotomaculaceae bacterium]|nr:bifunctional UDP-N-acetylglucosamine diphosphorylase/glucosamine-1-phosphate N-acetyltransferase GlmU [Desulfotomaculaceae bacterium]
MDLAAVILAAGKGTRMNSKLPKVLHPVCGSPMLSYVIDAVTGAGVSKIVVVAGYGAELVSREVEGKAELVIQAEQLGTAHALSQAGPCFKDFSGSLLVLCGDTPLIEAETLVELVERHRNTGVAATVLTAEVADPAGYGRVIRDGQGQISKIVEQKDASPAEILVREVNSGIYCFDAAGLFDVLKQITPANAQGEYYLTDVISIYAGCGQGVRPVVIKNPREFSGINDRIQLAGAEQYLRSRVLEDLMRAGVTIVDPNSTFVSRKASVGRDTVLYPFTFVEGDTIVGEDCSIGPGSRLIDAIVGNGVVIQNSIIIKSCIGDNCSVGPFAYLRPETRLGQGVKVGDFVEIKKSLIGDGSKVPHLSYVGDATIGEKVNIGAGTITCNYDGENKWPTIIGDGAFIGSNTNLIAPVEVGRKAVTGAGSTITKNIPSGALGIERAKQVMVKHWSGRKKDSKN